MLTSCAARENVRLQPGAGLTLPGSQPRFIIEQKTRSVQSLVSCGNDFVRGGCSKTLIFSIIVEEGVILTGGSINYTAINRTAPPPGAAPKRQQQSQPASMARLDLASMFCAIDNNPNNHFLYQNKEVSAHPGCGSIFIF